MTKITILILAAMAVFLVVWLAWPRPPATVTLSVSPADSVTATPTISIIPSATPAPTVSVAPAQVSPPGLVAPLDRAGGRVTKKPFGIYITPANSPVQPERFGGYHTGVDFEVFPEELNTSVSVRAICDGTLRLKETASGYGGVAIENCTLNGEAVTVIYGHLKLASVSLNVGDHLSAGETFAVLGADKSAETDGERKHLHLGIHRGSATNIKGYVASQSELSGWADPCESVCQ